MSPHLMMWLAIASPLQTLPELELEQPRTIRIDADDTLVAGQRVSRSLHYTSTFDGLLHVWLRSEVEGHLRIERVGEDALGDDGDGGSHTPSAHFSVQPGTDVTIVASVESSTTPCNLELLLLASPECVETRQAARTARDAATGIRQQARLGEDQAARSQLNDALDRLAAASGAPRSTLVAETFRELASVASGVGDPSAAIRAHEWVVQHRERTLPPDHPSLQIARMTLSTAMARAGQVRDARKIQEQVVEIFDETLPDDHPRSILARNNLANTLRYLEEYGLALPHQEKVVEVFTRTPPPSTLELERAQLNLAVTLKMLGHHERARDLEMTVVAARLERLPEDHPDVQFARSNLAITLMEIGQHQLARHLQEQALDCYSRILQDDDPVLQRARLNLATNLKKLGDLHAARELNELAVEALTETLADDAPMLQGARINLANTLRALGRATEARELLEYVLLAYFDSLPDHNPRVLLAQQGLANAYASEGDWEAARDILEEVVEIRKATTSESDPELLIATENLANALRNCGELDRALTLERNALARRLERWPEHHPELIANRQNLCITLIRKGEDDEAREVARKLLRSIHECAIVWASTLSPREAEARVLGIEDALAVPLSLAWGRDDRASDPELDALTFQTIESLRAIGMRAAHNIRGNAEDHEIGSHADNTARTAAELSRVAQQGRDREEILEARRTYEAAWRKLVRHSEASAAWQPVTPAALASAIGPGSAFVGFRRYVHWDWDTEQESDTVMGMAFVLSGDGELTRVNLGPFAEIEAAVLEWRESIGVHRGEQADRGVVDVNVPSQKENAKAARTLRQLVLDPVLAVTGSVDRLIVCLDGALHAIALDALAMDVPCRIHVRATAWELLTPAPGPSNASRVVVMGGVDYDQPLDGSEGRGEGAAGLTLHRGEGDRFQFLEGSQQEAREILELWNTLDADDGQLLEGAGATRAALLDAAPQARFLHLATHGWFADAWNPSPDKDGDDRPHGLESIMTLRDQVVGSSAMSLCGLALAGANHVDPVFGNAYGTITAQEFAALDLVNCELVVLSSCETHVGVRRVGQGVASLQRSLQMAGARRVLTSLWKVPDQATKELMVDFYRRLWIDGKAPADALQESKRALRDKADSQGRRIYTTRDWAAWVLTGNPN